VAEYVDDTEDLVNLELDYSRNRLLKIEILITIATFCIAVYACVAGVLGEFFFFLVLVSSVVLREGAHALDYLSLSHASRLSHPPPSLSNQTPNTQTHKQTKLKSHKKSNQKKTKKQKNKKRREPRAALAHHARPGRFRRRQRGVHRPVPGDLLRVRARPAQEEADLRDSAGVVVK
jgi:hypothetical protein